MSNPNSFYSEIFVDELIKSGLKHVCLAPGSRNTSLVLAFSKHDNIKRYSHLDERSAAFFALGLALANDEPVALVCTSGSAAANFFPAIVEAHQSQVPLIVITADRPAELRHSGANQTIDQVKIYGDYALWSVDTGLPENDPLPTVIRNLRTLAARAYAKANGIRKGVVHINMPFRKPLEPTLSDFQSDSNDKESMGKSIQPFTHFSSKVNLNVSQQDVHFLIDIIQTYTNGLIICGPRSLTGKELTFIEHVLELGHKAAYPIIADPVSGLRFLAGFEANRNLIGSYETFLQHNSKHLLNPDVIIRLGDVPISKWLNQYLNTVSAQYYIHIRGNDVWADDSHEVTHFIQADAGTLCEQLNNRLEIRSASNFLKSWQNVEEITWEILKDAIEDGAYFDGAVVYDVISLIPDGGLLFAGNSLSIRHVDQFGRPCGKHIRAYANRGASGIDGNISTALGIGAAYPNKPLVAIVGDITFYHDMNGLLAVQRCGIPITVVVINNNGGGIFHRLPIKDYDPQFTDYFLTPHGLEFSHVAALYGLDYACVNGRSEFNKLFEASVSSGKSTIIEIQTDAIQDNKRRLEIVNLVREYL